MITKIKTDIFIDLDNDEQAEDACTNISLGLAENMQNFPVGNVIQVDVDRWEKLEEQEVQELGLAEE